MAGIAWNDIAVGGSVEISTQYNRCTLVIGHNYFGFGIYMLRQYADAIFIGGVDASARGVTIVINGATTTITNNGSQKISFKIL